MLVNGRIMAGGFSAMTLARCGVWPSVLATLLAAGQETAPPNPPASAAPTTAVPAKGAPAAKSGNASSTASPPAVTPTAPASTPPASASATGSTASGPATPSDGIAVKIVPWEYSPYKIHVWLAAVSSPELGDDVLASLRQDLAQRADIVVGAPWSVAVAAPPASLYHTVALCPQLLTDAAIGAVRKNLLKDDKLILVSLSASQRDWHIWARELDCHTRTWGPQITRTERQPAALSSTVFAAVVAAFGPLARIEEGQGKTCVVRGRATGLITAPDSPAQIVKGDVLQPIFRQNDRYGNPLPGRTEALPFTFLHVTSSDEQSPSLLNCNVHSGMRSPIHGRSISTSRRERWAIKVRPRFSATTLFVESKVMKRDAPKISLSGIEVFSKTPEPELPKELTEGEKQVTEKKNPPELLGVTDWRGSLSIEQGGPMLRVMYLKNGGLLLARLPIVPGLDERVVAEIPDDNPRLQAEGFVRGLNSEVTDLVVQRQLIAVRMRMKITEGKLDEAEKLFEEFRGLKTLNDLQQMLNIQLQRQKPTNSPAVKQKIDKLYGDERELLAKFIDANLQVKLLAELSQARAKPEPVSTEKTSTAPSINGKAKTDNVTTTALPAAVPAKSGTTTTADAEPNRGAPKSTTAAFADYPKGAAPPNSLPREVGRAIDQQYDHLKQIEKKEFEKLKGVTITERVGFVTSVIDGVPVKTFWGTITVNEDITILGHPLAKGTRLFHGADGWWVVEP